MLRSVVILCCAVVLVVRASISKSSHLVCYQEDTDKIHPDVALCSHFVYTGTARGYKLENIGKEVKKSAPNAKFIVRVKENEKDLSNSAMKGIDGFELHSAHASLNRTLSTSVARELRSALGSSRQLLVALPPQTELIAKYYDLRELSPIVDLFVAQTQLLGAVAGKTYHPSRLSGVWDMMNTDSVVDLALGLGAPVTKLITTSPAKAFKFQLQNATLSTPGSPAAQKIPQELNQEDLCKLLNSGAKWTLERDQDLSAPYAFRDAEWIAFEDISSIDVKGKYSRVRGLAGLALDSVEFDAETSCGPSLVRAAHKVLNSNKRAPRGAVLRSLENEIRSTRDVLLQAVQLSPYRISRVVDSDGVIHAIREDTRTEFACSRQGFFVHPRSCGRFYRCVKFNQLTEDYTVFEFDCPAGLAFDSRWEVCVWPGSISNGQACAGSSEIAPVPRSRFVCPAVVGYYADPENCRWFFACVDLGNPILDAYEFRCPFGLGFDADRLICDWPWLVPACGNLGAYEAGLALGHSSGNLFGITAHGGQSADSVNVAAHNSILAGANLGNVVGLQSGHYDGEAGYYAGQAGLASQANFKHDGSHSSQFYGNNGQDGGYQEGSLHSTLFSNGAHGGDYNAKYNDASHVYGDGGNYREGSFYSSQFTTPIPGDAGLNANKIGTETISVLDETEYKGGVAVTHRYEALTDHNGGAIGNHGKIIKSNVYHDNSGAYHHDNSGAYHHDSSGDYHAGAYRGYDSGYYHDDNSGAYHADYSGAYHSDNSGLYRGDHHKQYAGHHNGYAVGLVASPPKTVITEVLGYKPQPISVVQPIVTVTQSPIAIVQSTPRPFASVQNSLNYHNQDKYDYDYNKVVVTEAPFVKKLAYQTYAPAPVTVRPNPFYVEPKITPISKVQYGQYYSQGYEQPSVQTYVQPSVQTYVQPSVQTYIQPPLIQKEILPPILPTVSYDEYSYNKQNQNHGSYASINVVHQQPIQPAVSTVQPILHQVEVSPSLSYEYNNYDKHAQNHQESYAVHVAQQPQPIEIQYSQPIQVPQPTVSYEYNNNYNNHAQNQESYAINVAHKQQYLSPTVQPVAVTTVQPILHQVDVTPTVSYDEHNYNKYAHNQDSYSVNVAHQVEYNQPKPIPTVQPIVSYEYKNNDYNKYAQQEETYSVHNEQPQVQYLPPKIQPVAVTTAQPILHQVDVQPSVSYDEYNYGNYDQNQQLYTAHVEERKQPVAVQYLPPKVQPVAVTTVQPILHQVDVKPSVIYDEYNYGNHAHNQQSYSVAHVEQRKQPVAVQYLPPKIQPVAVTTVQPILHQVNVKPSISYNEYNYGDHAQNQQLYTSHVEQQRQPVAVQYLPPKVQPVAVTTVQPILHQVDVKPSVVYDEYNYGNHAHNQQSYTVHQQKQPVAVQYLPPVSTSQPIVHQVDVTPKIIYNEHNNYNKHAQNQQSYSFHIAQQPQQYLPPKLQPVAVTTVQPIVHQVDYKPTVSYNKYDYDKHAQNQQSYSFHIAQQPQQYLPPKIQPVAVTTVQPIVTPTAAYDEYNYDFKPQLVQTQYSQPKPIPAVQQIVSYEYNNDNYYNNQAQKEESYSAHVVQPRLQYLQPKVKPVAVTTVQPIPSTIDYNGYTEKYNKQVVNQGSYSVRIAQPKPFQREYLPPVETVTVVTTPRPVTVKTYLPPKIAITTPQVIYKTTTQVPFVKYETTPIITTVKVPIYKYETTTFRAPEYLPPKAVYGNRLGFSTVGPDAGIVYSTTQAQPLEKVTWKPKVVVTKVNDYNPLLVRKLGAVCSCESPTVKLRGSTKHQNTKEYDIDIEYDDYQDVIGTNQWSGRPIQIADIPERSTARYIATTEEEREVIVTSPRSRVKTTQEPNYPRTYLATSTEPSSTVTIKRKPGRRLRVKVTPAPTIESVFVTEEVGLRSRGDIDETDSYDRFGPGGRSEALQATIDCQRAGLFRHPTQCNKFYACRWDCHKNRFTLHSFNCPVQLTFDSSLGACNWPSQGPSCQENTILPRGL